jgi:hypothetical protein
LAPPESEMKPDINKISAENLWENFKMKKERMPHTVSLKRSRTRKIENSK